jgi:hypothetical protein
LFTLHSIPSDLTFALKTLVDKLSYPYSDPIPETEGSEYGACTFVLNGLSVKFRSAKITPTKVGQFVTLWKRDAAGITKPHDWSDDINLFIINTRKNNRLGQFIFPKAVLLEKGILSSQSKEGKRGFRVYPPWDVAANKQALASQHWQLDYFLEIGDGTLLNVERARLLLKNV